MDESGRRGRIKTGKRTKSSSSKCSSDCWWPAREALLSEICWSWNVGTFDLSVYWLANSNLKGFELDVIFLSTITFIWNGYDGDCLLPAIPFRQEKPPQRIYRVMSTIVDGVYMRSWQGIILYNLHYRECRATKYQRTVHVACQFYSKEFFCIWWNKGTSDHDCFHLFNKYTGLEAAPGRQAFTAFNTSAAKLSQGTQA